MKPELSLSSEYQVLLEVSDTDYEALKKDIAERGQLHPIAVNEEGVILDGHLRYKACMELDIEPKFKVLKFASKLEEKAYVLKSNLARRNLNKFQRAKLGYLMEPVEQELAKQRRAHAGGQMTMGATRDVIANNVGISGKTYERAKYIIEHGPRELQRQVEIGEISVSAAYNRLHRDIKLFDHSMKDAYQCPDAFEDDPLVPNAIDYILQYFQNNKTVISDDEWRKLGELKSVFNKWLSLSKPLKTRKEWRGKPFWKELARRKELVRMYEEDRLKLESEPESH